MSVELPAQAPLVNAETQPFWDATAESRLVLPRCDDCGFFIWYPRLLCPSCRGRSVTWTECSGVGTVYSYTVVRKGQGRWRDAAPYVHAYVELDEGPRLLTNIVECDPDTVHIGQIVELAWADTGAGSALPRFRPQR